MSNRGDFTGRRMRLGLAVAALLLAFLPSANEAHAQGGPTWTPVPQSISKGDVPVRYIASMNGCLCTCAGLEAGWECGVMGGPICSYNPVVTPDEMCGGSGPCMFSGWGCERGSPSDACDDKCFGEVVLKPLCAEAVTRFNLDEAATSDPSHLHVNSYNLNDDMWKAVELYNYWADSQRETNAHVSENMGGTVPALTWLFAYEGIADGISKRFVFLQDEDRSKTPDKAPGGTEPALWRAITDYYDTHGKNPLTPKEVFFLALKERKGDAREALLLAHNTLRSLAREGSNALTNVPNLGANDFNKYFETLRAPTGVDDTASSSDSSGLWYHYFGMAFYEVQSRGDQTAVALMSLSPLVGPTNAKDAVALMQKMEELAKKLAGKDKTARSTEAEVLNEMEQLVRQYGQREQSQPPDPEKYCMNLWGADIGAGLWDNLPALPVDWSSTIGSFNKGSVETAKDLAVATKDLISEYGSKALTSAYNGGAAAWKWLSTESESPPTLEGSPSDQRRSSNRHRIVIEGSSADITWQDADGRNLMMFDQETENLYGIYEIPLFPYYEEDNDTWGMGWISPVDEAHKVQLTASADGPVHLTVIDPETGDVSQYAPELTTGQTVSLDFPAGQVAPAATMEDGTEVQPETSNLKMEDGQASTEDVSGGGGSSSTLPLLIGAIAAVLVIGLVVFFLMRRSRLQTVTVATANEPIIPSLPAERQTVETPVVLESSVAPVGPAEAPAAIAEATQEAATEPAPSDGPAAAEVPEAVAEAPVTAEEAAPVVEAAAAPSTPAAEVMRVAAGGEVCACGAVFAAGARFCRQCGARVPEVPRCPSCGSEISTNWRFCKKCGARIQ